jgi:[ribosomal protein S18]-alanine N-acetyltransferase
MREGAGADNNPAVGFRFRPLTQADAEAIAAWHYAEPYTFYDWIADPDDLAELLDPETRGEAYAAVDGSDGDLIGFFSSKPKESGTIEVGLGLRPEHTGRGLGLAFVEAGLEEIRSRLDPKEFSLAVATFNRRAITVYERAGFREVRRYTHHTNGSDWEFVEMRRPA